MTGLDDAQIQLVFGENAPHEDEFVASPFDRDYWVARRCGHCLTGYAADAQLPIVIVEGIAPAIYFDNDRCAEEEGYAAAVALRRAIEDYGVGHCVVTNASGQPVDAATYAMYASERRISPLGPVDAGDPNEITNAIRQLSAFLATLETTSGLADAYDDPQLLMNLEEEAAQLGGVNA